MFELDDVPKTAILVAVVLVTSAMMMPVVPTDNHAEEAKSGSVQTPEPRSATQPSSPSGEFYEVPESHTKTVTPALEPPSVKASNGSQTMSVAATTVDGEPALQLEDDRVHEGRWVSVPTKWFRETLGETPDVVYIEHSSGDQYSTTVHVREDSAAFYVERFSTNTVTFSGSVTLTGNPATDGATYQYSLESDSVDNFDINVTGAEATEWDNASATGLANGDTLAVNPAGHRIDGPAAGDPQVVLTGEETGTAKTETGTMGDGQSFAPDVTGNLDPAGPSSNDKPTLALTAHRVHQFLHSGSDNGYAEVTDVEVGSVEAGTTINEVRFKMSSNTVSTVDIYIQENAEADTTAGEGQLVASGVSLGSSGWYNVTLDTSVTTSTSGKMVVSFDDGSGSMPKLRKDDSASETRTCGPSQCYTGVQGFVEAVGDPTGVSASADDGTSTNFGNFADGETKTNEFAMSNSVSSVSLSATGGRFDYTLDYTDRMATEDPAVDLDGDGVNDVTHSGLLNDTETATYAASSLGVGDDTATISTAGGSTVGVEVQLQEVAETRDPSVEVNGQPTSYTGTLADGDTVALDTNTSWIQQGTNQINVSVGDGTLSADAPTPAVGLDYSHDADDQQSVNYEGEQWSERYNVSKTYGATQQNATLTIPFDGNVVGTRSIEKRVNETSWQTVDSANYNFKNTTLTVELGNVDTNEKVEVRADGTKVQVANGEIQVIEPTPASEPIASEIEITAKQNSDFHISYGGTSGRIYYTENETWSTPETAHFADSSGHKRLYVPNANAGSTFHVHSIPVTARPNAGEVRITDTNGNWSEPSMNVTSGATVGDEVEFTFQNATDNADYVLYSQTNGLVRDSGTANSPITLLDDDSTETLIFLLDEEGDSTGGSTDSDTLSIMPTAGNGDANWLPIAGVALVLAGLVVVSRDPDAVENAGEDVGSAVENLLGAIPAVGGPVGRAGRAVTDAGTRVSATVLGNKTAATSLAGAVIIGAIQGGIIALPQGSLVIVVVAGVAIFSGVALREFDEWSLERWAIIVVLTGVIALEVVSPSETSLLTALTESDVFPLLAVGMLIIAWKAVQALRQPDEQTTVVVEGGSD